jgi:hypothetical protein
MSCPCEGFGLLAALADWFSFVVLRLDPDGKLGHAVRFFVFEAPKVLILLTVIVFVMGIVRSFFTPERTRRMLAGKRESVGNVLGALLGVATPFCSCSAVPMFIGFVTAGVPLGVTFSFLVASPMVNEVALAMLAALFGWKVAALYAGMGLAVAILSGWIIGRLHLEKWVEPWVYEQSGGALKDPVYAGWRARGARGGEAVQDIVGRVWPYVLIGIAVGAGIHGYVPEGMMAAGMGRDAWWSVPVAVLLGVPMYSNAAGVIPVLQALLEKGVALGTALAFMMAVIGLSLPEAVILRKVLKPCLLLVFFSIVAVGIMIVGYVFNALM